MISVIVLSWAKTDTEFNLTKRCLCSLREHGRPELFRIVVVETNPEVTSFGEGETVIHPEGPFHFNRFVCESWNAVKDWPSDAVFVLNNDLVFQPGYLEPLIEALKTYHSVSPWCPDWHTKYMPAGLDVYEGYHVGRQIAGWSLCFRRSIMDVVPFEELFHTDYAGWYSDRYYANTLKKHGLRHALIKASKVRHLGTQSFPLLPEEERERLTRGQWPIYQAGQVQAHTHADGHTHSHEHQDGHTHDAKVRRLQIAVYTIAKNEETHVRRWADSTADADVRLVVDTGSTDRTVQYLREANVTVHQAYVGPFRFDTARNVALALLPADVDVCVSLDMDEVLTPGWRETIDQYWKPGLTCMQHAISVRYGEHCGSISRIHARDGHQWVYPIHEVVVPVNGQNRPVDVGSRLTVLHFPDNEKLRNYLALLEHAVQTDPSARMYWYLAREYRLNRMWPQAIAAAQQYLGMPTATWNTERGAAMLTIACGLCETGDTEGAVIWAKRACEESGHMREPLCALANLHQTRKEWRAGYRAAVQAMSIKTITDRDRFHAVTVCWQSYPHDRAAVCAWNLGLTAAAEQHARKALEFEPTDGRLRTNLQAMRSALVPA